MNKLLLFLLLTLPAAAIAEEWKSNVSHRYNGKASLKVTGTEDLSITVEFDGNRLVDTSPAIFNIPNADKYVQVTARKGKATWRKKVEIKRNHQTILQLTLQGKAGPDKEKKRKTKPNRKYLVVLRNSTDKCGSIFKEREVQFHFVLDGNKVFESRRLDDGESQNVNLFGGTYDVRYYVEKDGRVQFKFSKQITIDKDGQKIAYTECYRD